MQNSTTTLIALVIAILLIFIVPIVSLTDRNDDVVQEKVEQVVQEFVTNIRNTGVITTFKYQTLESTLSTTGNTYDIEIELQILDENPGKKNEQANYTKIGENVYYTEYTSQVLDKLSTQSGQIKLKEGDYIAVSVKNQNDTVAQRVKSSFLSIINTDQYEISASSSGMITMNGSDKEFASQNYTIDYDMNYGVLHEGVEIKNIPISQAKKWGESIKIYEERPTTQDYTFLGWSTTKGEIGDTDINYVPGDTYTDNESVTLYAVWQIKNMFTITYHANGGQGQVPGSQTKYSGDVITLANPTNLTKPGYYFDGWITIDGRQRYGAGYQYGLDQSINLYAIWEKASYTIKYDANWGDEAGSGEMPQEQIINQGETIILTESINLEREKYRFMGWSTMPEGEAEYKPGDQYTYDEEYRRAGNKELTLYAIWYYYGDDLEQPVWVKDTNRELADPLNKDGSIATFVVQGVDKNFDYEWSRKLENNHITVYVNGEPVSNGITVEVADPRTIENGVEYTITVKGYATDANQVKIKIAKDLLVDWNDNRNKETEIIIYNTLKSTAEELDTSDAFLGNGNVIRGSIENVVFLSSISGANDTKWDVSEQQDGSILAWYETNNNGLKTVYIGSNDRIYANQSSGRLFASIGTSNKCTIEEVISNINLLNTNNAINMSYMFYYTGSSVMTELDLEDNFDTSNVTDMSQMFAYCGYTKMTELKLGNNFNTNNVTDMLGMFEACGYTKMTELKLGNSFNTSNVTDMSDMFAYCGYNQMTKLDLGNNFDTSNVTDMSGMFGYCGYTKMTELELGDKFNTNNVNNMAAMFWNCGYIQMTKLDLGNNFDTSNVTDMSEMFEECGYTKMTELVLGNKFNTDNVNDMFAMFRNCGSTSMTKLDLGEAFTEIAENYTDFVTGTGKSNSTNDACTIYVSEAIFEDIHNFKLNDISAKTIEYARGILYCKYELERPEWTLKGTYYDNDSKKIIINLLPTADSEVLTENSFSITKDNIHMYIDGELVQNASDYIISADFANSNTWDFVVEIINPELVTEYTEKSYKEWSGNISLVIDEYSIVNLEGVGNKETVINTEKTDRNTEGYMFIDYIKPEIKYVSSETAQDGIYLTFDVFDKYFLKNIITNENLVVKMNGQNQDYELYSIEVKGNADKTIGERVELVIEPTTQAETVVSLTIPQGIFIDKSGNTNDEKTITVEVEIEIPNTLQIGDFVDYDAGTWTQEEINAIKVGLKTSLVAANGSTSLPDTAFQFGGFTVGSSRNGNATPYGSTYKYVKDKSTGEAITGWRVFDIEEDGSVILISAGNPEDYYYLNSGTNIAYINEFILTGQVNNAWNTSATNNYQKRDWSNYINTNQKAESATVLTKSRLDNWYSEYIEANTDTWTKSTFQKIYENSYTKYQNIIDNYSEYWLSEARFSDNVYAVNANNRQVYSPYSGGYGIRVLITISPEASFALTGERTVTGGHTTQYGGEQTYNVWDIEITEGDTIKPEIQYVSSKTTEGSKTVYLTFDVLDKNYSRSTITDENLIVKMKGQTQKYTVSSTTDIKETINGTEKVIGCRYTLEIALTQSGTLSVVIPEGVVTDTSGNKNDAKTITIGIEIPIELQKGDFVNYDAGTWTQAEIDAIQTGLKTSPVTANGSTDLPNTEFQFGGFTAGSSRNGNATPYKTTYNYVKDKSTGEAITGWRVFDIEEDGSVTLISAGNPEDYKHHDEAYESEYILTGQVNSDWSASEANNYQKRNWSNYINSSQKAVSATVLTKSRLDSWYSKYIVANANTYTNSTFRKIYEDPYTKYQNMIENYSYYMLPEAYDDDSVYYVIPYTRNVYDSRYYAFGLRVLVSLSSEASFALTGEKTVTGGNTTTYGGDQTYNVWDINVELEEKTLQVGDFINYDAGTWTQTEIDAIQVGPKTGLVQATGSKTLDANTNFQFGGFEAGDSRNGHVTVTYGGLGDNYVKDSSTGEAITGWRVFDIVDDGSVILISAGNPEHYTHSDNSVTNYGYISEYILTGQVNSNWSESEANNYQKRDWSKYINASQKAENATVLTKSELDNWYDKYIQSGADINNASTFQKIFEEPEYQKYQNMVENYSMYWLSEASESTHLYNVFGPLRTVFGKGLVFNGSLGVRVLVTLSPEASFALTGEKTVTGGNTTTYGGDQTYNVWDIK